MPLSKENQDALKLAAGFAGQYRGQIDQISPYAAADLSDLIEGFDIELTDNGRDGPDVINHLVKTASSGLVGNCGPAFFSWVMGASNPVGVAADWLTSAWGQNAAIYQTSPAAATAEEVSEKWLIDLLHLPPNSSVGFTSGATMASFISLCAARISVLDKAGWDLHADGIFGAPEISVFISEEAHTSIYASLRYLGFGRNRLIQIQADQEGRMSTDCLSRKLAEKPGPKIIIAQAGHINSGAFDDFETICELANTYQAWVHIDGAFGMWAQCDPTRRQLSKGAELADSWAVDGHKMLQIPYASGFAIIRDRIAHKKAMAMSASYLNQADTDGRNPSDYVPELSRRAQGFAVWAVLQALGRNGIRDLVVINSDNASRLASILEQEDGIKILNTVCLNQVSLCFEIKGFSREENDHLTLRVIEKIQAEGLWFVKSANWKARTIMRLSFSSAPQSSAKIQALATSIIDTWQQVRSNT